MTKTLTFVTLYLSLIFSYTSCKTKAVATTIDQKILVTLKDEKFANQLPSDVLPCEVILHKRQSRSKPRYIYIIKSNSIDCLANIRALKYVIEALLTSENVSNPNNSKNTKRANSTIIQN